MAGKKLEKEKDEVKFMTLSEVWKKSDCKPMKIRMAHWEKERWYLLLGFADIGAMESYGYHDNGIVCGYDKDQVVWVFFGS